MTTRDDSILVTGSSGFIARHMISAIQLRGGSVVGIDRENGTAGFGSGYRFAQGDICDREVVEAAMQEVNQVIHLAAEHRDFGVSEEEFELVNVEGTRLLLELAGSNGVRDLVFYSSVAVYGSTDAPSHERMTPAPESPYGRSKLAAERLVEQWAVEDGRRAVIIRPTVIFGPFNYANMYRLIEQIARRRYLQIGTGDNIKSVGYVENIVDATLFLMDRMEPGVEIFNFADEPHLTSRQIAATIAEALNVPVPSFAVPQALAVAAALPLDAVAAATGKDVPITSKRIAKFNTPTRHSADKLAGVGFSSRYTSVQGLQRMVDWFVEIGERTS